MASFMASQACVKLVLGVPSPAQNKYYSNRGMCVLVTWYLIFAGMQQGMQKGWPCHAGSSQCKWHAAPTSAQVVAGLCLEAAVAANDDVRQVMQPVTARTPLL